MTQNLTKKTRYLHWIVAILVITLFVSGKIGENIPRESRGQFYMIHGSIGTLALIFGLYRLIHRLREGWPAEIVEVSPLLKVVTKVVHWILLLVPVLVPISGLIVNGSSGRPIVWFGIQLSAGSGVENKALHELAGEIHEIGAMIFIIAFALHLAAALKHHYFDKDDTLKRMTGKA